MMQNFLWMIRKQAFTPQTWSTERTNYVVKCLVQGNALENWTSGSHGRYSSTQSSQRVSSPHPQGTEAADLSGCTQDKFGGIPSTLGHIWTAVLLTFAGSCYPERKKKLGRTLTPAMEWDAAARQDRSPYVCQDVRACSPGLYSKEPWNSSAYDISILQDWS